MQTFASVRDMPNPHLAAKRVFDLISSEMALVEAEYERQASSNIQVIDYLGAYLRSSGGKRVRPALLILSNYAAGGNAAMPSVIRLATVMEMLHTATLVHDDIIDNAEVRRNRSSVNARFGNQSAVLMGDWLYMSAFETTVAERSLEIIDILTRLTRKMTEGELIQLTLIGHSDISQADYFEVLERKTAFLFSACCEVGAILAGASSEVREALSDFGMNLGVAFQIADDLLDITASTETLGKAAGTDLIEGKLTLPLIYLLETEPSLRPKIQQVITDRQYSAITRDDLLGHLDKRGILTRIREQSNERARLARKNLDVLPESEYRSCLEDVLNFVIQRNN